MDYLQNIFAFLCGTGSRTSPRLRDIGHVVFLWSIPHFVACTLFDMPRVARVLHLVFRRGWPSTQYETFFFTIWNAFYNREWLLKDCVLDSKGWTATEHPRMLDPSNSRSACVVRCMLGGLARLCPCLEGNLTRCQNGLSLSCRLAWWTSLWTPFSGLVFVQLTQASFYYYLLII